MTRLTTCAALALAFSFSVSTTGCLARRQTSHSLSEATVQQTDSLSLQRSLLAEVVASVHHPEVEIVADSIVTPDGAVVHAPRLRFRAAGVTTHATLTDSVAICNESTTDSVANISQDSRQEASTADTTHPALFIAIIALAAATCFFALRNR